MLVGWFPWIQRSGVKGAGIGLTCTMRCVLSALAILGVPCAHWSTVSVIGVGCGCAQYHRKLVGGDSALVW